MSTYVFDHGWQREHDRLLSLEALFDAASRRDRSLAARLSLKVL